MTPHPARIAHRLIAGVVAAAVLLTVGVLTAPLAHACSLQPVFFVSLEDLADADPENVLAHLQDDFDEWAAQGYGDPAELPKISGAWFERAVVAADPPKDHYASVGGVTILDAAWGVADIDPSAMRIVVDTSSCAGEFPLPEPGAFHLVTDSESWFPLELRHGNTVEAITAGREIFDRLFGKSTQPVRDLAAEREALNWVLARANEERVGGEPLRFLDTAFEMDYAGSAQAEPEESSEVVPADEPPAPDEPVIDQPDAPSQETDPAGEPAEQGQPDEEETAASLPTTDDGGASSQRAVLAAAAVALAIVGGITIRSRRS